MYLFIFLNDSSIANYSDDNTPYATAGDFESVVTTLESLSKTIFQWLMLKVSCL